MIDVKDVHNTETVATGLAASTLILWSDGQTQLHRIGSTKRNRRPCDSGDRKHSVRAADSGDPA